MAPHTSRWPSLSRLTTTTTYSERIVYPGAWNKDVVVAGEADEATMLGGATGGNVLALATWLRARRTLSSTASGQDVHEQKRDDDYRRGDSDDGDGGGGYDHGPLLAPWFGGETRRVSSPPHHPVGSPARSDRRCLVESPLPVCSRGGVAVAGRTAMPVETQRRGVVA